MDPNTIGSTVYRGAHPGGTAPIGKIVDSNQETEIKGLFVSDASVLALMYLFIDVMMIGDTISKIVVQIIVIVLNYIFSKLIVFKD